jgi:hypothetical protein
VWDCLVEAKIFNPQIEKLEHKTISCHFIGYPDKSKGYHFYCPNRTTKYTDTRHAVFLECDVSSTPREIDLEEIQDYVPPPMTHDYIPTTILAPHVENTPSSENIGVTPAINENENVPILDEQQAENSGANEAPLDNEQEVEPEQPQGGINEPPPVRRSQRERKSAISKDYIVYISEDVGKIDDPASYKEAMMSENSKKWLEAMEDELGSMSSNGVWDLVEIPDGAKKVGCKWVNKTKYDSKGKVETFKARLVAKGFS